MTELYLFQNKLNLKEFKHTTSKNLEAKYKAEGWRKIGTLYGWNCSIAYNNKED